MNVQLRKIPVLPFALTLLCLHGIVGLGMGFVVTAAALINPQEEGVMGFGAASVVVLPILNAVLGFCLGAVIAFLYNVIASKTGGIKLEFEEN